MPLSTRFKGWRLENDVSYAMILNITSAVYDEYLALPLICLFMTEIDDVTPKTNCPETILSPVWRPTKDIETKRGETTSGIELCHYAKFHADRSHRRRDI